MTEAPARRPGSEVRLGPGERLAALPGYPDLGPDDLVLSHFSLGLECPFEDRVLAAAQAGFTGIGLYVAEYRRLLAEGARNADLRAVLDHHGIRVVELEALRGWLVDGPAHKEYLEHERAVFAMGDALGPAHHVQVLGSFAGTLDDAAEAFAGVCDRAAEHGLAAAIEFVPEMTNIPDAATALEIVERAGRHNGGICVDVWHHVRGADDAAMLRRVPAERILAVQINDGPRERTEPDYLTDALRNRRPPGEGDFDLVGFLKLLSGMGVRVPLSVEVISSSLGESPAEQVARRLSDTTRSVMALARG
jgi:sugar phosphate isomerase/epimerase